MEGHRHLYRQTWFTNREGEGNANLLVWNDKATPEQTKAILDGLARQIDNKAVVDYINEKRQQDGLEAQDKYTAEELRGELEKYFDGKDGQTITRTLQHLFGSAKKASQFLNRECDIDGMKYPATKREGNSGWNYVSYSDANMRVDEHVKWSIAQAKEDSKRALQELADGKEYGLLHNAKYGEIRFPLGSFGKLKDNGKYKGGMGFLHVIYERMQKDHNTLDEAIDIALKVAIAAEIGEETFEKYNTHHLDYDGARAIIAVMPNETAIITGYEIKADDYSAANRRAENLQSQPHVSSEEIVAALKNKLAQEQNNASLSSNENKPSLTTAQPTPQNAQEEKVTVKNSLVRQVNPIVTNGQVHDEYQSLLDTLQTTPFNLEKLEAKARAWFDRVGDNAFDMIRNQEEPGGALGTVIRRMAMETEEFRQLPEEERREIMTRHIMEGSDWSHEGMARQMANRVIRTPEDAKRLFGRMKEKLDEKTYQKMRQNVFKETGIDIEALPKDIVEDPNRLDQVMREAITSRAQQMMAQDRDYQAWEKIKTGGGFAQGQA